MMRRACLYVKASALAAAISAAGCAPDAETSRSPVGTQAAAQAAFVDLGTGLVYDEALDITWLKDANLAKTAGYDADGLMNFADASAWAASLVAGGMGGWRLPTFDPSDPRPAGPTSANEIGSLLGGLTGWSYNFPSYPPDTTPFVNLPGGEITPVYWTGLPGDPGMVWYYYMSCG